MKVLLFGKNGQLGRELQRALRSLGEVIAVETQSVEFCGDLGNLSGIADTVRAVRPDVVVNAAAWTDVDQAETQSERAHLVNALAPGVLAQACSSVNAWCVHYSSDYVFDGSGNRPWRETDVPDPLNTYGRTKLEGDILVAEHCARHLIIRTSWLYSAHGGNFAKSILQRARKNRVLQVVDDQTGAPTGADLVADVTVRAIEKAVMHPELQGLYHLAAGGEVTRHGYARFLIDRALAGGWELEASAESVQAISSNADANVARRPPNSRLNTEKLQSAFGIVLPDWTVGVERLIGALR